MVFQHFTMFNHYEVETQAFQLIHCFLQIQRCHLSSNTVVFPTLLWLPVSVYLMSHPRSVMAWQTLARDWSSCREDR
uniref:Uncharacterized protein n=1 Tax=Anguilla anguilla TaxID=7936 RepID=A0A0E9X555_ANGAN